MKAGHILDHKEKFNKFKIIQNMEGMFDDANKGKFKLITESYQKNPPHILTIFNI